MVDIVGITIIVAVFITFSSDERSRLGPRGTALSVCSWLSLFSLLQLLYGIIYTSIVKSHSLHCEAGGKEDKYLLYSIAVHKFFVLKSVGKLSLV